MRPAPWFVLGINSWHQLRPTDRSEGIDGGDFEALAEFFNLTQVEARSAPLWEMQRVLDLLQHGDARSARVRLERWFRR